MEYRDFEDILHELLVCWCREVDIDITNKRHLPHKDVDKFIDDVGTYASYLFSAGDRDAMDQAYMDTDVAREIKEKTLRKFTLIQGGKKDEPEDDVIN